MKNFNEFCEWLLEQGFKEFPAHREASYIECRSFEGKRLEGPLCECNERKPPFQIYVYNAILGGHTAADFVTIGEQGGEWTEIRIYGVSLEKAQKNIEVFRECLSKQWKIFCENMKELEND